MDISDTLQTAESLAQDQKSQAALERYNDAFNLLVDQATAYARTEIGTAIDETNHDLIKSAALQYSNDFLKRDLVAATILNAMGLLFAELGDYDNAKQKFEESIDYIPVDMTYDDPRSNLDDISSRIINTAELVEPTDE